MTSDRRVGRPLRVCHVVPDLRVGGAERHVTSLMPGLDHDRFTPSVVCIGEPGALFDDLAGTGVTATALRRSRNQAPAALVDLIRVFRRMAPDIVITRGYNADMLGRLAAIIARVPCRVVWVHHHSDVDDRPRLRRLADRVLDRFTDAYFGVAQAQRPFLVDVLGYPAEKVRIIHNGVDVDTIGAERDRSALEPTLLRSRRSVVGTVSAMRPEKDHPTLLRAVAQVAAAFPDAGLLVVGDGPERARIEALACELGIADRAVFTGSRSDVAHLLSSMDVFVLSSRSVECFPMALLEAMAAGIPSVCTDVGGVAEMIVDGVTGFLVPPGDPAALAARVTTLLSDPAMATRMGAAARRRVCAEFGLDTMVRRTQEELEALVHVGGGPIRLSVVMDLTFVGGAEVLWLSLFRAIDRSMVVPRVICLRAEGALAADFRAADVEVEVMAPLPSRDPRRVTRLAGALRRSRTDVVLVAHHHRASLVIARVAAAIVGIPSVVAAHDMDLTSVGKRVLPRSTVATLFASRALVLLSAAQGNYLHREEGVGAYPWARTREVVIGNGVEIPVAPTDEDRTTARHRMGVMPTDVVIGIVARLSPQKAHEVLFSAFATCLSTRPDALLVVIGTGERDHELRDLAGALGIAHRVRFLGVRRDIDDLLSGLDVSCLSSVHEGVPMILIESMAAGVPVVATDCGSVTDVVTDSVDGYVVPVGDHDALADRLITLTSDADLRRRLGAAGRATVESGFDITHTAQGYQDLVAEVVMSRSRTRT